MMTLASTLVRLTAALILFAMTAGAQADKPHTVPFELLMDEYMVVEVVVQDSITDRWLFDTGAGLQVVSQATFDRLTSVTPAGRLTGFRMMGERLDAELYRVSSLEVAGYRQENVLVAPWPELDNAGISGIVSLKFFENRPITIDFANKTFTVETAGSAEAIARTGQVVPMETQRYRDKALDIFVNFTLGDTVLAEFELDTGSGRRLWIDSRFMEKLGIDTTADSVTAMSNGGQVWQVTDLSHVSLRDAPSVASDSIRATFRDSLIYDGVMGIAFWDGRAITIDLPNRRLVVH